jgi:hypothetical protein
MKSLLRVNTNTPVPLQVVEMYRYPCGNIYLLYPHIVFFIQVHVLFFIFPIVSFLPLLLRLLLRLLQFAHQRWAMIL